MSQWGEFQGRIEDNRLVRGQGQYVADLTPPGMTHAVVVRAQVAQRPRHGRSTPLRPQASPGVLAVYHGQGPGRRRPAGFPLRRGAEAPERRRRRIPPAAPFWSATASVRSASRWHSSLPRRWPRPRPPPSWSPSRRRTIARGRPTVLRPARPAHPPVWDEAPDNVAFRLEEGRCGRRPSRGASPRVARLSSHVSRVAALSLEPRGALGLVDEAGRLVLHASNQSPHALRSARSPDC